MPKITYIEHDGTTHTVEAEVGSTVMETAIRNNVTDLWLIIGFGVLGYGFERLKFPIAPLVLGAILGPIAEETFMNTMISFSNDWTVFFTRPISGTIVALTVTVLLLPFVQRLMRGVWRGL